jgi:hypothetical protein
LESLVGADAFVEDTRAMKAGFFLELPYGSRFCGFVIVTFALRDGPAVADR